MAPRSDGILDGRRFCFRSGHFLSQIWIFTNLGRFGERFSKILGMFGEDFGGFLARFFEDPPALWGTLACWTTYEIALAIRGGGV